MYRGDKPQEREENAKNPQQRMSLEKVSPHTVNMQKIYNLNSATETIHSGPLMPPSAV